MRSPNLKHELKQAQLFAIKLEADAKKIEHEIQLLKKLGVVDGTIHQQQKRPGFFYHYLNYQEDGQRVRKYLGNDEAKVQAARESIARFKQLKDAELRLDAIVNAQWLMHDASANARHAARTTANTQRHLHRAVPL